MRARTAAARIGVAVNKLAAKALAGGSSQRRARCSGAGRGRSVARVEAAAATVHRRMTRPGDSRLRDSQLGGRRDPAGVPRPLALRPGRDPYGEGRRNEHSEPHLIASWDADPAGLEPGLGDGLDRPDVGPLVRALAQPVKACERASEQWVYHLVLRNDEADRRLSDDEWAEVCRAAMDRTGIAPAGDPAGCRWVAVRHAEEHVHLEATPAREDGRPPRIWNAFRALGGSRTPRPSSGCAPPSAGTTTPPPASPESRSR